MSRRRAGLPCLLVLLALLPLVLGAGAGPGEWAGKWIEVDRASGRLYAHEGQAVVRDVAAILGTPSHPAVAGRFHVQGKERRVVGHVGSDATTVPWVLHLDRGDIHGRYYKRRMGHHAVHGAITLPNAAAEWLYNWAEVGTPVTVHN